MAILHVRKTGNDSSGDGSPTDPYLTIQKGLDMANANDTIVIESGTYTESFTINKSLTINGENVNVAYNGTREPETIITSNAETIITIAASNVILNGFEILSSAIGSTKNAIKVANGNSNITNIQIKNSIIHEVGLKNTNWYSNAILLESQDGGSNGEISNVTIQDNYIYNIGGQSQSGGGTSGGIGIHFNESKLSNTITGNKFYNIQNGSDTSNTIYGIAIFMDFLGTSNVAEGFSISTNIYDTVSRGVACFSGGSSKGTINEKANNFTAVDIFVLNYAESTAGGATITFDGFYSSTIVTNYTAGSYEGTVGYFPSKTKATTNSGSGSTITAFGKILSSDICQKDTITTLSSAGSSINLSDDKSSAIFIYPENSTSDVNISKVVNGYTITINIATPQLSKSSSAVNVNKIALGIVDNKTLVNSYFSEVGNYTYDPPISAFFVSAFDSSNNKITDLSTTNPLELTIRVNSSDLNLTMYVYDLYTNATSYYLTNSDNYTLTRTSVASIDWIMNLYKVGEYLLAGDSKYSKYGGISSNMLNLRTMYFDNWRIKEDTSGNLLIQALISSYETREIFYVNPSDPSMPGVDPLTNWQIGEDEDGKLTFKKLVDGTFVTKKVMAHNPSLNS